MASGSFKVPALRTRTFESSAFTTGSTRGAFIKYDDFGTVGITGYQIISVEITNYRNPGSYIAIPVLQDGNHMYCEYYTSNVNVSIVAKDCILTAYYLKTIN